jgi:hypothetical protein
VTGSGFGAVPEKVREVGQQVVQISQDVGSIVSSGAATIQLAGSGNAGFLATPAMAGARGHRPVTAPTGIIGSEGLAEWTRRQQGG